MLIARLLRSSTAFRHAKKSSKVLVSSYYNYKSKNDSNNYILYLTAAAVAPVVYAANPDDLSREKSDEDSKDLEYPSHVEYLIVGGGTAAQSAVNSLRGASPKSKILLLTEESYRPYMRPPLSKQLWETTSSSENLEFKIPNGFYSIFFEKPDYFLTVSQLNALEENQGGVALATNSRVVAIDPSSKTVKLESGSHITYDKCLLAPGGEPRELEVTKNLGNLVSRFRSVDDYKHLLTIAESCDCIAVVGGGFMGSEIAIAIRKRSKEKARVVQFFPEDGVLGAVLPKFLSSWTTARVQDEGIEILQSTSIKNTLVTDDQKAQLHLSNGDVLTVDHVVLAAGLVPNTKLAGSAGLEIDPKHGGYLVNSELSAYTDLYVAGDAACFYDHALGRRRVEHHDHAVVSGRLAAENMVGKRNHYTHQSMFWSTIGSKVGFEAIGIIDSSLDFKAFFAPVQKQESSQNSEPLRVIRRANTSDWPSPDDDLGRGVVFYFRNDVVVGVITWNMYGKIATCRRIIGMKLKESELDEYLSYFDLDK